MDKIQQLWSRYCCLMCKICFFRMAHMVWKNAISNIYFELGEFHELCNCFLSFEPMAKDAQQIWFNLVSYCAAMFTIYSISILNLWESFVTKSSRNASIVFQFNFKELLFVLLLSWGSHWRINIWWKLCIILLAVEENARKTNK